MKEYRYRGYSFRQTTTICSNNGRYLYEIDDLKERGIRPFLTSVRECMEYIKEEGER